MGAVCTAKHHKNSNLNLYNQFYFVTGFYSLDYICMADRKDMVDKKFSSLTYLLHVSGTISNHFTS